MAKKKRAVPVMKAEATAKAELVAKATYRRTRVTTEVIPPDVTRAKAGAWLDLISPITEWAGLKGDQLRSKRSLFRIQQEETLLRVAQAVRLRVEGKSIKPVPPKILVPALEKASLEEPSDDAMIQRWAELLAAASQEIAVQPRFVGILGELAGSQAECLEMIAFNNFRNFNFPVSELSGSPYDFAEHAYRRTIEDQSRDFLKKDSNIGDLVDRIASKLNRPGVFPELIFVHVLETDDSYEYDTVRQTGVRRESDLAILESLGLVRRAPIEFFVELNEPAGAVADISIYYFHLTELGVAFCEVCSRKQMVELEKIDEASHAKRLELDSREL
jgi:hypothetical protein